MPSRQVFLSIVVGVLLPGCSDTIDGTSMDAGSDPGLDAGVPIADAGARPDTGPRMTTDGGLMLMPVRTLPGLRSIIFWERTGGTSPQRYEFTVDGPELTTRLVDPLGSSNRDIAGAATEYYDVYYSNEDGSFNLDGSYLTISGVFEYDLPAGGGLNLAEIELNVEGGSEYGNVVGSFVSLGDNGYPDTVGRCIDGDKLTHSTMGNTVGSTERLRITLGFPSTVILI